MAQVDTVLNDFILNVLSDEEFQNLAEKDGNQLYFTDLIEYYTKEEARALMTLFRGQFADWASVPTSIADYLSDFSGSKTPTQNNFMVVKDASGYATDACDILSHVQSTGTQYINLGIMPTIGMKYVASFQASDTTSGTIFGTDGCDMYVYQSEHNPVTEVNISTSTLNGIGFASGFAMNYELTINENSVKSKLSNITLSNPYRGELPTTEMYLFAKNTADVATDFSACIVRGFKVYEGETLLMDLVPARRVLDGAIGFMDVTTNIFYENLGTDPLIAGDVVSAAETPDDMNGSWMFIYNGEWNDNGKSGWTPAFALGSSDGDTYTKAEIDDKFADFVSKGMIENLKDDIVKRGITANSITLTDSEKENARNWIGASAPTVFETMPDVNTSAGEIYQYVGETTEELTSGYFYKSVLQEVSYITSDSNVTFDFDLFWSELESAGITLETLQLTEADKERGGFIIIGTAESETNYRVQEINGVQVYALLTQSVQVASSYVGMANRWHYNLSETFAWERVDVQPASEGDLTKEEADATYLKLTGGEMTGRIAFNTPPMPNANVPIIAFPKNSSVNLFVTNSASGVPNNLGVNGNFVVTDNISTDSLGSTSKKVETAYIKTLNNGADLVLPTEGGTLARTEDIQSVNTNINNHINNTSNPHSVTKAQVGLENVDNTSDINKPISTATQTALNLKADKSDTYTKSEVDAKVSSVYRFMGSVATVDALPADATVGDTYNIEADGSNYAWTGTAWDKLSETVNLTPYLTKEDAVKTYETIESANLHKNNTSNPHNVTAAQVGLGNVNNTSDANKPISTATQNALNLKANISDIVELQNNKLDKSAEISLVPTGSVTAFAGTTPPTGWLKCDGSAISRTTYAALFAAIGTRYGSGNGSTTFNLPTQSVLPLGIYAPVSVGSNGYAFTLKAGTNIYTPTSNANAGTAGVTTATTAPNTSVSITNLSNRVGEYNSGLSATADLANATGAKAIVCIKY